MPYNMGELPATAADAVMKLSKKSSQFAQIGMVRVMARRIRSETVRYRSSLYASLRDRIRCVRDCNHLRCSVTRQALDPHVLMHRFCRIEPETAAKFEDVIAHIRFVARLLVFL